jgi:general secretion pathway protein C
MDHSTYRLNGEFSANLNASYDALMSTLEALRSSLNSPRALLAAYERYGAWLPKAAAVLLTIALAHLGAELVWALVPQPAAVWQPPPAAPSNATSSKGPDLSTIANANLFGQYQAPQASQVDPKHVRESTLNLTLLGVFAWDEHLSRAIIQPQGSEAKPFAIRDTIVAGVTLQEVLPDRVILSRNGRLESLRLNKGQDGEGGDTAGADDNGSEEQPASDEEEQPAEDASTSLGEVRNVLLSDPSRAAEFIRVMPLNAGNGLNGYRVYPGPDRTLFTNTGLRPGDVVTAINGVQLNDPGRALQMLGDLAHTNNLSVTVNRGGTNQNIQVNLNQ